MSVTLRDARATDAAARAAIYNHYIEHTTGSFEEVTLSAPDLAARLAATAEAGLPWLVADAPGGMLGYAYAGPWNGRCAYRATVEVSIYLVPDATGAGIGTALYSALFDRLRAGGYHAVIGGIALPNPASVALHEKFDMARVALFPEVGFKFGQWLDVGYWQVLLESQEGEQE